MNLFDIAAVLISLAALLGYLNHRWLKFPPSIGIMAMALLGSLVMLVVDRLAPSWGLHGTVERFLGQIDFSEAVLHGMLCFLLFAGALHVDWAHLRSGAVSIAVLSVFGVALSAVLVGTLSYSLFHALGLHVTFLICMVFGALISPTDPIAVLGLLKTLHAPKSLEAKIAGESLFNDGVGVVAFFACLSLAGLAGPGAGSVVPPGWGDLGLMLLRQVGGGLLLGVAFGYVVYRTLRSIDQAPLELLLTVALVMLTYSVSFWLAVSGPIAVVAAGLVIGAAGRQDAMSPNSMSHVEAFWEMTDEILNAVLFLLLGLEVLAVHWQIQTVISGLLMIPIVLLARFLSVGLPVGLWRGIAGGQRGFVPILTWGGLRGGLSIAMVLSLPPFPAKNLLLGATYAVVVFSVLVQGLSMPRVCAHYGLRRPS
jgi:CPA1 family monovalent cation:H+ antiporter